MNTVRQGNFLVEMSGADVVWDQLKEAGVKITALDRRLYCRICGLEAAVTGGAGWPSCCDEPMRSATTRQPERVAVLAS